MKESEEECVCTQNDKLFTFAVFVRKYFKIVVRNHTHKTNDCKNNCPLINTGKKIEQNFYESIEIVRSNRFTKLTKRKTLTKTINSKSKINDLKPSDQMEINRKFQNKKRIIIMTQCSRHTERIEEKKNSTTTENAHNTAMIE